MKEDPLLSISEVAKEIGVSESRLYEAFKKSMGVTPNEMRQRILCEIGVDFMHRIRKNLRNCFTFERRLDLSVMPFSYIICIAQ